MKFMCRIKRLSRIAKREASKSDYRYKLAAILLKGGSVISVGHNTINKHAEVNALLRAKNTQGSTLLVFRLTKTGFGLAKPCHNCEKFIRQSGVEKVIYSAGGGEFVTERLT